MTPLIATLARALYAEAYSSGWDHETQDIRDGWYGYAERVLGTEYGQRIADVVEAAEDAEHVYNPGGFQYPDDPMARLRAALDALGEPSDDEGAVP